MMNVYTIYFLLESYGWQNRTKTSVIKKKLGSIRKLIKGTFVMIPYSFISQCRYIFPYFYYEISILHLNYTLVASIHRMEHVQKTHLLTPPTTAQTKP